MDRRFAPYAPLEAGRPARRRRILRTAELNMVGRTALAGCCVAAAGLGFVSGRLLGWPVLVTAPAGGLLPLVLVTAADRRRWRTMRVGHGWGRTVAEVSAVAADLAGRGVEAEAHGAGVSASLRIATRMSGWSRPFS